MGADILLGRPLLVEGRKRRLRMEQAEADAKEYKALAKELLDVVKRYEAALSSEEMKGLHMFAHTHGMTWSGPVVDSREVLPLIGKAENILKG